MAPHDTSRQLTGADRFAIAIGLPSLLIGILLLALGSGVVASIVGAGLVGLAGIAFVALAFLLIGESEDREYQAKP
jgi:hypothetical protein